jgi:hypothetical protein
MVLHRKPGLPGKTTNQPLNSPVFSSSCRSGSGSPAVAIPAGRIVLGRPPCDPSDFVSPRKPPSSRACRAPQIAHVTQRGPPSLQSTWGPRGRQRPATVRGARRPEGEVGPRRLARCSTNLVSFCALLFSSLLSSSPLASPRELKNTCG